MAVTEQSYYGVGVVWMRKYGAAEGLRDSGQVDALNITNDAEKITLTQRRTQGGGARNSIDRINSVNMSVTFRDFSPENFAIGIFGAATSVVAGSIIDEQVTAYHGKLSQLTYPAGTSIDVQDAAGGAGTTFALGTDYEIRQGGIYTLATGTITDGQTVYVDYDNPGVDVVEAIVNSGFEYEIYFDGLNEAQSGAPFTGKFYRCKASLTDSIGLLDDDYGSLVVPFEVLQDSSITTSGLSQYYKMIKQSA